MGSYPLRNRKRVPPRIFLTGPPPILLHLPATTRPSFRRRQCQLHTLVLTHHLHPHLLICMPCPTFHFHLDRRIIAIPPSPQLIRMGGPSPPRVTKVDRPQGGNKSTFLMVLF